MSQRNPQNQRYINRDENYGKSRKSAASAKPKSNAAASVRTVSAKNKSKVQKTSKRQRSKQERDRQYQAEQRYGDPPTKKFKMFKRIWLIGLIFAVVFILLAFAISKAFPQTPQWIMYTLFGCSYACIILVLYIDLGKIRKMRRQYAAQMHAMRGKEIRAEEKRRRAEAREAQKAQGQPSKPAEEKVPDNLLDKVKLFFKRK